MAWTEEQLRSIQVAETVTAVFSLTGCSFIITTFCSSPAFRKPINRLIFYASFGNILAAVAMLIARHGVVAGQDSALCQMQAFFIQQWMPADPLWSFCMALNVYLTFYKRYSSAQLRSLEWKYFLCCYGVPFIPNLTMFFIRTKSRGRIYGPATIWCSITTEWQFLRIACFYGPVWLISLSTLAIFLKVGHDVFSADRHIRQFVASTSGSTRASSMPIRQVTTVDIQQEIVPLENPYRQNSLSSIAHVNTASGSHHEGTSTKKMKSPESPGFANTESHKSQGARSYLRYSLLFFIAMVVTWLPTSINRVYSLVHPTSPNYALSLFAASVLPLQGLWNSLIYLTTSFSICSDLVNTHVMAPIRRRRIGATRSRDMPYQARGERLGSVVSASVPGKGGSAYGAQYGYGRG